MNRSRERCDQWYRNR